MATIFLSYSMRDKALAKDLELRLQSKGHTFRIGVGTPPVGKWRAKLINALRASDAVVPLLSQYGLQSSYVASEIGAARAFDETKGMLLLPVVIGERFDIPSFVADYHCFYLPTDDAKELDRLAGEISEAIVQHVDKAPRSPRIFVSHRHKDKSVAGALVSLLEAAFHIDKMDIRCTSVQPYTLAPGDRTSDRLRAEIGSAELVLGLLTPETAESNYACRTGCLLGP